MVTNRDGAQYAGKVQDSSSAGPGWWAEMHGTRSRYRKGCNCDACVGAEREYRRQYRAKRRAERERKS
jgi:hypothetical protein